MPIYEYRCGSCGHEVEALQKLSEPALTECPACHAKALSKLVSAAGFQLKGSGWYATDFRSGSKPAAKANGEAKADAKVDADSKSGSSDSKSESKSEAASTTTAGGGCGSGCACH